MKFEDLAVDHDYYCSDNNYHSRDASSRHETWADFYEEYHDADIDMNLCFRWDIKKQEESEGYWMEIFMIHQRKGLFHPCYIEYVGEDDLSTIKEYLYKHWQKLQKIWAPISEVSP